MRQQQLYGIALFEGEAVLTDYTGNTEKSFVIDERDLQKFFRFERTVTFRPFEGLVWQKSGREDTYLITIKRQRRTLIHRGDGFKLRHIKMELPNMAVKARVQDGQIHVSDLWAYPGPLKKNTQLYGLPLPNLTRSRLCMGAARIPFKGDVIKAVETALFETPWNHHQQVVGREQLYFQDYLDKYRGKCPFHSLSQIGFGRQILED